MDLWLGRILICDAHWRRYRWRRPISPVPRFLPRDLPKHPIHRVPRPRYLQLLCLHLLLLDRHRRRVRTIRPTNHRSRVSRCAVCTRNPSVGGLDEPLMTNSDDDYEPMQRDAASNITGGFDQYEIEEMYEAQYESVDARK